MRLHIIFGFKDVSGGGNQFLKALKAELQARGHYAEEPAQTDAFLFNSYQFVSEACTLRRAYPAKLFFHRVDGPIRLYNNPRDFRDRVTAVANRVLADGTIFQSEWSKAQNRAMRFPTNQHEVVIGNAPDPAIFNREGKTAYSTGRKTRLIAVSWSDNWKKGFDILQWLDSNLDFARFEMTFVGRSPIRFRQIKHIPPVEPRELAKELKSSDVFIATSRIESCSNALLEALHSGLPVLAPNASSNPEILGGRGCLYKCADEIPTLLGQMQPFRQASSGDADLPTIGDVAERYQGFFRGVLQEMQCGRGRVKSLTARESMRLRGVLLYWHLRDRLLAMVRATFGKRNANRLQHEAA